MKRLNKGGRTETSRTENVRLIFTSGLANSQLDSFVPFVSFVSFCSILCSRPDLCSIKLPALPRQDGNSQQDAVPGEDLQTATLQPAVQAPEGGGPTTKETAAPRSMCEIGVDSFPSCQKSMASSSPAPAMTGMAIRNENAAAELRVRPTPTPVAMVEPLRDRPGRIATA